MKHMWLDDVVYLDLIKRREGIKIWCVSLITPYLIEQPDEDPYELKKRLLDELGSHNIGIDHILEAGPRVILAKFDPKFADQVCHVTFILLFVYWSVADYVYLHLRTMVYRVSFKYCCLHKYDTLA